MSLLQKKAQAQGYTGRRGCYRPRGEEGWKGEKGKWWKKRWP